MYRRIPCEWFLDDGIHPRKRLDAPEKVEQALKTAGVLPWDEGIEQAQASEWIFRRVWTYSALFGLEYGDRRMFLRLTGLHGAWRIYINGALAAQGDQSGAEFEITALLKDTNELKILFEKPISEDLRPEFGFDGALMYRLTGNAAITRLDLIETEDGNKKLFAALDLTDKHPCELELTLKNSDGEVSERRSEDAAQGYTPVLYPCPGKLKYGSVNELSAKVMLDGEISDEASLTLYVAPLVSTVRGVKGETEFVMDRAREAGANTIFSRFDLSLTNHRALSARHGLESAYIEDAEIYTAPEALKPLDALIEKAGGEDKLEDGAIWYLSGSDKGVFDKFLTLTGDTEAACTLSRINQAKLLRDAALKRRLANKPFIVDFATEKADRLASNALFDSFERARPGFYGLKEAWEREYAYVCVPEEIPEDGVFSCEVNCVTDTPEATVYRVEADVYGLDGKKLSGTAFAAMGGNNTIGRFTVELPKEGCAFIRTRLIRDGETVSVSDRAVYGNNINPFELPGTQILAADGKILNAGGVTAFDVCVPDGGYFGCLLPGEAVEAMNGGTDTAEGMNIFI